MKLTKYFGPSTLVAAAFIGPGTLTTCTMAGVQTGYKLLWAIIFSTFATLILQEMAARLGWYQQKGLGEVINNQYKKSIPRILVFSLVISAILIGNAAYEAGNLSGAVLGMELLLGEHTIWVFIIPLISFCLLWVGKYVWIERILIGCVLLMSSCFLMATILLKPDIQAIASGLMPSFEASDLLLILGLIGTTVVPYNLFLHASTISKKWKRTDSLRDIQIENAVSILLGGFISALIIITAASQFGKGLSITKAQDLAIQLESTLGNTAPILLGLGLLAAGLSSALTAPLAASYAAKGLFDLPDENHKYFKATWMIILLFGSLILWIGYKPIYIIKFAQITNAVLLPLIALFLIFSCNKQAIMGNYVNKKYQNLLGLSIILITLSLSLNSLNKIFKLF